MDTMNWDALTADERDWLVHEMVMLGRERWSHEPVVCPSYTQSMDAAWLVVQSLKDVDHLTLWGRKDASGHASCSLALRSLHSEHRQDIDCDAETMPEAICKAVLKAAGILAL